MAKGSGDQQPQYTAADTGVENGKIVYWNPITSSYMSKPYDWNSWNAGEKDAYIWYRNELGDFVYGLRPPNGYLSTQNINGETIKVATKVPDARATTTPVPNTTPVPTPASNPNTTPVPSGGGATTPSNANNQALGSLAANLKQAASRNQFIQGMDNGGYPGRESPWGDPRKPGNNPQFYANQIRSLLAEQENYQRDAYIASSKRDSQDYIAAAQREYQQKHPKSVPSIDWSWAELPEVQVAQSGPDGQGSYAYVLDDWIRPGITTDAEIYRHYGGSNPQFDDNGPYGTATDWSQLTSPTVPYAAGQHPSWTQQVQDILNQMFTQQGIETPAGGGPTAAPGYALPVAM